MCNVKMISAQCGFCLRLYTLSIWDKMFSSHLCRHVQPICCGVSDILCVQPTLQYHSVQNQKMIHLKKTFVTLTYLIALWLIQLRYVPLHYLGAPGTSRGVTSLKFGCLVWERPLMTSHVFLAIFDLPTYLVLLSFGVYFGVHLGPPLPTLILDVINGRSPNETTYSQDGPLGD